MKLPVVDRIHTQSNGYGFGEQPLTKNVTTALNYLTQRDSKTTSMGFWTFLVILNKFYYLSCSGFHKFEVKRALNVNDHL